MHTNLLISYLVFCIAMVSPGPDFFITLRNALKFGTKSGILTACGIAAGLIVHMSYCVAGIGLLISQSILLFNAIKWAGAAYLVYIGIQAIRSKGIEIQSIEQETHKVGIYGHKAFVSGLITNLFNPKATLFFLALFTQMINPHISGSSLLIFAALSVVTAACWFSAVSVVITTPPLKRAYVRASKWIDRVAGAFFIGLGLKLAESRL